MRLLALAAALLAIQETNEAEKLFRKMEEKVAKAATVRVKMAGAYEATKTTLAGDLLLGDGARMKLDLELKAENKSLKDGLLSDGKQIALVSWDRKLVRVYTVPERMGEAARMALARGGLRGALDVFDPDAGMKAATSAEFAVSGFTMGAKEKVGEREAQAVNYTLERKGEPASDATVWIDTETHLPLKHVIRMDVMVRSETYSEFKVGEKIDPAKFELPKDK